MSEGNIFGASMVRRNESPIGFHFDGEPVEQGLEPGLDGKRLVAAAAGERFRLSDSRERVHAAASGGSLVASDATGRSYKQVGSRSRPFNSYLGWILAPV